MDSPTNSAWKPLATVLSAIVFATILLVPLVLRFQHPSLYADDVARVGDLQENRPLRAFLFTPFNEHMAPLFQSVSATTWNLADQSLAAAPLAFTLASFVPHLLALILLGILVRRETKSPTTALIAVALFGLSSLMTETFLWYSASSFSWAMLGTLAAIECAGRAATGKRSAWLIGSAVAALLAPAFSAIGLLAGPLAMLRIGFECGKTSAEGRVRSPRVHPETIDIPTVQDCEPGGEVRDPSPGGSAATLSLKGRGFSSLSLRSRIGWIIPALTPLLGTFGYLGLCIPFRYGSVVSQSLERNLDLAAAIRNVLCAPSDVLLPGLFGRMLALPDLLAMTISTGLILAVLFWAWRDRSARPLILVGLGLIVGGYILAFGARSAEAPAGLRHVQRYQLFPQLGLVLLLAMAGYGFASKFDDSRLRTWSVGLISAFAILMIQLGTIREHAKFYRWPDQAKTLAAIERVAETCRRQGITRSQCLKSLDPIRNRWFDFEFNGLMLIPQTSTTPRVTDGEVRSILLASINGEDREYLFGGMEVSRHFVTLETKQRADTARFVKAFDMTEVRADQWKVNGWASFVEYEFAPGDLTEAHSLALRVSGPVEVWWSPNGRSWTEARSIRWRAPHSAAGVDLAVSLDQLPHWDGSKVRRVRIAPREAGEIAVGIPRLLR